MKNRELPRGVSGFDYVFVPLKSDVRKSFPVVFDLIARKMTRHVLGNGYRAAQQGLEQNMVRYHGESGSPETRRNSKSAISILFARWDNTYQVCWRDKTGCR
ncbi:hypothetical protein GVv1_08270 [Enterobacter pseudoroggenkampii]